ncbi:MAG: methyltransferase [Pseudomonadota bacterium]
MTSRLSLALDRGAVTLPEGPLLLLRPPPDLGLSALPPDRTAFKHGFRPAHDALLARGLRAAEDGRSFAAAVVFAQRARELTFDLLAQAVDAVGEDGLIVLDGHKTDGIEAVIRRIQGDVSLGEVFSKAHGKCVGFAPPAMAPAGWRASVVKRDGFVTRPGVFSADGPDPGSRLLAAHLPTLSGHVADLGAGWGYLGRAILASDAVTAFDCVEAERLALDCARENLPDARARFHWADATAWTGGPYDTVVMNPPFHSGRAADPELGKGFIRQAARCLLPAGRLWMVANRQLPYEDTLSEHFAEVFRRVEQDGYKVIEARKPRRRR